MRSRSTSLLPALFSLSLAVASAAGAQTFTPIDVPGASTVTAAGINRKGQIVGSYLAPNRFGYPSSFLLDRATITRLDVPGAVSTVARAINDGGQIVGTYVLPGDPGSDPKKDRGFLYDRGVFSTIQIPGAAGTHVVGINKAGDVVGEYFELGPGGATGPQHGFVLDARGTVTELAMPGALITRPYGINDADEIVGVFITLAPDGTQQAQPFLFDGTFHRLDLPAHATPYAITNQRIIAGTIAEPQDFGMTVSHGFVAMSATTMPFDAPSAAGRTSAYGMNDKGQVVGAFTGADGVSRGFVLSR
jgi:uncharacterized membrane protein